MNVRRPAKLQSIHRPALPLALCSVLVLGACSSFHVPFMSPRAPDLRPARSAAESMVEIDAATRSGCASVRNIERPERGARDNGPQRWIAHTCNGDLVYDVIASPPAPGQKTPTVKVVPAGGVVDRPANPNAKPAQPEDRGAAD